jgi:aldehyde:ferredoxin oxidoreductase
MVGVGGVNGRLLVVDLTNEKVRVEPLDAKYLVKFVGGAGYATWILYQHVTRAIRETGRPPDPLSPDNPLIVMTGPMTGLSAFSYKVAFVARSPLTGLLGKSIASGTVSSWIKRAGFDGIVFLGRASEPSYVVVYEDGAEIKPATKLWGLSTLETLRAVQRAEGEDTVGFAIGPAGEKLVRFASIVTSDRRIAGRTGMGAVMGSKLLKAVVVKRGTREPRASNQEELMKINAEWVKVVARTPRAQGLREYGTAGGVSVFNKTGNLPIKHWTVGSHPDADRISGKTYMERFRRGAGRKPCSVGVLCSIACERVIEVSDPRYGRYVGKGPEYETVAMLGSNLMIFDPVALVYLNNLCDELGMDTISAGEVLAWLTEAYEAGLIPKEVLKDVEPRWGDYNVYATLLKMIARREGVGDLLAEGVRLASQRIGGEAVKLALHVKGLEVPAHNPRLYPALCLQYATSNRGACHLQGMVMLIERGVKIPEYGLTEPPKTSRERVEAVIKMQNISNFIDSAILCKFGVVGVVGFDLVLRAWNSITGLNWGLDDIMRAGERIWYLERVVNYLMGMTNRDDTVPDRFVMESVRDGGAAGAKCSDLDEMLIAFYEARKLRTRRELAEKLKELDLGELVEALDHVRLW